MESSILDLAAMLTFILFLFSDAGHLVSAVTHPVVNHGDAHVRVVLTVAHHDSHINTLIYDVTKLLEHMNI